MIQNLLKFVLKILAALLLDLLELTNYELLHQGLSLNRSASFAEIYDTLENVCSEHQLPLALTWAGRIGSNLSLESSCFISNNNYRTSHYKIACERKHHLVEGQGIAGKALQSNKPFLLEPSITKLKEPHYPFASAARVFGDHAAVAICLQNKYTIDELYVLEFFLPCSNRKLKEKRHWARCIFDSLKNMKKMFVRLRLDPGNEVDFHKEAISNINPHMTMADPTLTPALYKGYSLNPDEPGDAFNQQGEVISNFNRVDMAATSFPSEPIHLSSPLDETFPTANRLILPHEQENGNHNSLGLVGNNENQTDKPDHTNKLSTSSAKRRKLSNVWEEFYKEKENKDGKVKVSATCSHCNRKFDGSSKKGTTHLRNHLKRCKNRATQTMRDQELIFPPRRGSENQTVDEGNSSFDQHKSRMDVARMVIKNQLPLSMVEDRSFSILLENLQPMFKLQSKEALSSDILHVYKEEKDRLIEYFGKVSCRLNVTISLGTDDLENITYYCFAVQFVDEDWVLKKKIIAVKNLGQENDPSNFLESFKSLLVDWNLDKKVCSLTIHNAASPSLKIVDEDIRKSLPCFEVSYPLRTFYISCDGCISDFLGKYRSDDIHDDIIRSIHDAYRKLSELQRTDYNNWWTCSLVLTITSVLDPRFKFKVVEFLYSKIYGKYYAQRCREMKDAVTDIFNEYARRVHGGPSTLDATNSLASLNVEENITMESFQGWCNFKGKVTLEASRVSELDTYLDELPISSKMDRFEVLAWWRQHDSEFPILTMMARDFLAIPLSTILSAHYSSNERVMTDNPIFKGLDPHIIEAMICARDWLQSPKERRTVLLLDEQEPQPVNITDPEVKIPNWDDPESVEICFKYIGCLAPGASLSSPIMNFYIGYLQQQASRANKAIRDFHVFNTFFYPKLKEVISYKGTAKESFIKLRRWWKGVNLFQKAYVLIPIHEVFMREEWNYLNQEVPSSDLPIVDKIWNNLPSRIGEKTIEVPQQENDYDCGLFVLFFMERFIEEAPERLKSNDLAMFGEQWFRPEEASGLRAKIKNLLIEKFQASNGNIGGSQSP